MKLLVCFLVLITSNVTLCANILCLMGVPSPSHHIWNRRIMEAIAAQGHNLTIISADVEANQPANINYIHLEKPYEIYHSGEAIDLIAMAKENLFSAILDFYNFGYFSCEGILTSKGLDVIMNYPDDFKFDLVLYDFTCGPCLLGLHHKFKHPPLVSISAFNNPPYTTELIGGHKHYAYTPYYALDYDYDMNFFQRTFNGFIYTIDALYRKYIFLPRIDKMMRERFPYKDMPYGGDMDKETMLILVNAHYSVDFPESVPPNLIPVGGLQIKEPKPLPKDIEDFLVAGKKGSVLFSLGTNVRSDMLDKKRLKMFLDAFKQIPQYNFIWKFESDLGMTLPKNVQIRPWLPQNDILGHSSIKAFITHSGLLSTQEASWHGVPMIGIPFICDQYRNLKKSMNAGVAEKVDFVTLSTEEIRDTVLKVLETPKYTENVKTRSALFKDQPIKPIDLAVWWIEWAIRHPKATQLQSPTLKMGHFRSEMYDVLLFALLLFLALAYYFTKIFKCLFGGTAKVQNNSKKNN